MLRAVASRDLERADRLAAVLLLAAMELQLWLNPRVHHPLPAALAALALAAAVAWRRPRPATAVVLASLAVTAQQALGGALTSHAVGALLATILIFYGLGAFATERAVAPTLLAGLAGVCADAAIASEPPSSVLFGAIVLVLLPCLVGRLLRERSARERHERERIERLDAGRERQLRSAQTAERSRIARELHDVIAHCVSVMVIQAAAARTVLDREPDRAQLALQSVERAGRDALAEMRRLLGALADGADPRALAPQPGLDELRALVDRAREAGLAIELMVDGEPERLAPALDLCAYRIVQEALTNTIKHAGPTRAVVRVGWCAEVLELEVSDDGCGSSHESGAAPGAGHGIVGMRERVALHGGSLHAGPGEVGGFAVRARLPLTRALA